MKWKMMYAHHEAFREWEQKEGEVTGGKGYTICGLENSGLPVIDASVPGNFELDLMREGLLEDLYYSVNTLKAQELEDVHVCYYTTVPISKPQQYLHFEGIDTFADIYINGQLVKSTDNMFLAYDVDADWLIGNNEVVVHIKPAMLEARKYPTPAFSHHLRYNMPALSTRKAAHMYGWDIMPRIVSAGIWREVTLCERTEDRLNEVYLAVLKTEPQQAAPDTGSALLQCYINADLSGSFAREYRLRVEGEYNGHRFSAEDMLWHNTHSFKINLEQCYLWWPRNYGQPALYNITVTLYHKDQICDQKRFQLGIRTVELRKTAYTDKDHNGEFGFWVNKKPVFAMGSNWVPLDAFHSRDESRLASAIDMLNDIGCNIVRCWGGNVYESEAFYEACDANGIMVWQDFSMACGNYPREEAFAERLYEEAVFIVKRLRNHACIVLWSGDNECDAMQDEFGLGLDPNHNFLTRRVLLAAVENHAYTTPYLPSSPFISKEVFEGKGTMPEMHLWGPRDYFKGSYYKDTFCHFASETGYHGFPSVKSLKCFLKHPEKLWKEEGIATDEYLVHAACMECVPDAPYTYRIPLAYNQVVTLFGKAEEELENFVKQSQISQAEAKKYFIEKFRIGKWKRTGIIWWNLVDGWPQVSDAVVDYYGCKKLAYHYIKRSQQPVCLMFDEPVEDQLRLIGVNDLQKDVEITYTVSRLNVDREGQYTVSREAVLEGRTVLGANLSTALDVIEISPCEKAFYLIEWYENGRKSCNHYFTNIITIDYKSYLAALEDCGMAQFEGMEKE